MQDQNKPLDLSVPEDGSIPAFLRREVTVTSEKEVPPMITKDDEETLADVADEEQAPPAKPAPKPAKKAPAVKTPRKAAAKANGKGNGKTAVKAQGKKAAPAAPAKGKAKAKAERQRDPDKLDAFGFRKGSIKSKAAAMYAKGKGATLAEVREALGSVQFNLLTELEKGGFTVEKNHAKGDTGRGVTRYKIHAKE
jgi:hypothetical protein